MEASEVLGSEDAAPAETQNLDEVDPNYVPRYVVVLPDGRRIQSDDPSEGEVLADIRPDA